MKRFFLTFTCALVLAANASAQGTFNFGNTSATLIGLSSNGVSLGPIPGGIPGEFQFQLFIAPAGTVNSSLFVATNVKGTNISAAGRIIGGNGVVVPGAPAGGTGAILVRGWSNSLGTDYDTALANWQILLGVGWLGESAIAPNFLWGGDPGTGTAVTASLAFGSSSGIQSGFILLPSVPEPSTAALMALGMFLTWRASRRR
jgi:hypothetical protein